MESQHGGDSKVWLAISPRPHSPSRLPAWSLVIKLVPGEGRVRKAERRNLVDAVAGRLGARSWTWFNNLQLTTTDSGGFQTALVHRTASGSG